MKKLKNLKEEYDDIMKQIGLLENRLRLQKLEENIGEELEYLTLQEDMDDYNLYEKATNWKDFSFSN